MKQRETILASGVSSETPIHTQATARPWETDSIAVRSAALNGHQIALCEISGRARGLPYDQTYDEAIANAALIVKAVNSHEALIAALEHIAVIGNKDFGPDWEEIEEARAIARAALAGAK